MSDPVGAYEPDMQRLLEHLGQTHPRYAEALTYQQRLHENLAKARQYGDTPTLQHDRAVIVAAANALAQDTDGPMLAPAPSVHTQAMRPVLGVLGDPRHIRTDGGDYAEQSMDKRQGTFYETHHHYRDAPAQPPTDRAQRVRGDLLAQLATRYTQRLEDSLHEQVRIALDLHTSPAAVAPHWRLHLHGPTRSRDIPPHTPIHQVFDNAGGELLILGAPGAGKTTLLLKLARELVACAQADANEPIPVVVNLASWAQKAKTLEAWLPDALHTAAGVSKAFAQRLLTEQQLLLLLDGLDEVAVSKRDACIAAINTYCADQRPLRIVVCSRTAEYAGAGARLEFAEAVEIAPLTLPQVEAALADVPKAAGVLLALRDDPLLRELLTTPLMLHVTLLAYIGQPVQAMAATSLEQRQEQLFAAYMQRMLHQRPVAPFTRHQMVHGVHWLADKMRHDDMTDFLLERMQPRWLPTLWAYRVLNMLATGLLFGLVGGLLSGLLLGFFGGLATLLLFGLFLGLLLGLVGGLRSSLNTAITPVEQITWSWKAAWAATRGELRSGVPSGLTVGLVGGLSSGLFGGFVRGELVTTVMPNQGIRASLRNGLLHMLVSGLLLGLLFGLVGGLLSGLLFGLLFGLFGGLLFGSLGGLLGGLLAFLQHYILRFLLARHGLLPWDAVGFLDTARDLLFLQRDGGIYRFRHILLRDYFAALTPEELAALVEE